MELLSRIEFKRQVFDRDGGLCVCCKSNNELIKAVDAHHIYDRSLWEDGGYYLNNGVSLCAKHHQKAEYGMLSPYQLRVYARIKDRLLPPILPDTDEAEDYNKWGVSTRIFDSEYVKYPRTPYLNWSSGKDHPLILDIDSLIGKEVVITEKFDGENTTMYQDHIHARSMESEYHPSRSWVQGFHGQIKHDIPYNFRICGENMYAEHSIHYDNLPTFFLGFSVWHKNLCLDWDTTLEWFQLIGVTPVKTLARGLWPIELPSIDPDTQEGYVLRLTDSFLLENFHKSVGKYVRKDHIQTDDHWKHKEVVTNGLVDSAPWL